MEFTEEEMKLFKETEAYEELPYGEYKAILERVEAGEYGKDGNKRKQLLFSCRITDPERHDGFKHTFLVPLTQVPWLLKKILKMFDIDQNIELPDVEKELILKEGSEFAFKYYQNAKGYSTTDIRQVFNKESSNNNEEEAESIKINDDDIPF